MKKYIEQQMVLVFFKALIIVVFLIGFWFTQKVRDYLTQRFVPLSHGCISV